MSNTAINYRELYEAEQVAREEAENNLEQAVKEFQDQLEGSQKRAWAIDRAIETIKANGDKVGDVIGIATTYAAFTAEVTNV